LVSEPVPQPPPSGFTQALVRANRLDEGGFQHWHIDPAMRFGAARMWWADLGPRPRPHEGVDLLYYRDRDQALRRLDTETQIPAMYDGTVVRLCDDFIGRSVMMGHRFPDRAGWFYTLYGHTHPCAGQAAGQTIHAGETVAHLAPVTRPGSTVLPHLHISVGWSPESVAPERLDWTLLPEALHLLDPLPLLDSSQRQALTIAKPYAII
jgi:hypothetical protein